MSIVRQIRFDSVHRSRLKRRSLRRARVLSSRRTADPTLHRARQICRVSADGACNVDASQNPLLTCFTIRDKVSRVTDVPFLLRINRDCNRRIWLNVQSEMLSDLELNPFNIHGGQTVLLKATVCCIVEVSTIACAVLYLEALRRSSKLDGICAGLMRSRNFRLGYFRPRDSLPHIGRMCGI